VDVLIPDRTGPPPLGTLNADAAFIYQNLIDRDGQDALGFRTNIATFQITTPNTARPPLSTSLRFQITIDTQRYGGTIVNVFGVAGPAFASMIRDALETMAEDGTEGVAWTVQEWTPSSNNYESVADIRLEWLT
jgi:hypothetical protein